MLSTDVTKYVIPDTSTVLDALTQLNQLSGVSTTIFIADSNSKIVGSITDGDLRRTLVAGHSLTDNVRMVMHRNFTAFTGDTPGIEDIRAARAKHINIVPHLNGDGTLRNVIDLSRYHTLLPIDAVLMAGGRGERLRPLTLDTPKPLLRIADKCIIDYNIEALARNGVTNISVTTNYLSQLIEEHFASPVAGINVQCVREPKRLGTIGSLSLIPKWNHSTIMVMNADLLTSIDMEAFYLSHVESGAMMSIASIPYTVSVPYAILHGEGSQVTGIKEKPTYNFFANAGIYLLNRECIHMIPNDEYFDATDLIQRLIDLHLPVNRFTLSGTWIDIGSPDDFRQAQELIKQHRQLDF